MYILLIDVDRCENEDNYNGRRGEITCIERYEKKKRHGKRDKGSCEKGI